MKAFILGENGSSKTFEKNLFSDPTIRVGLIFATLPGLTEITNKLGRSEARKGTFFNALIPMLCIYEISATYSCCK